MTPVHTVGHRAYVEGTKNAHGNSVDAWASSVDLAVFSIAPRMSAEPEEDRDAVVVGLTLLAPPGTAVGPHDLIVIDGEEWKVDGDPADWTRGPFGFEPGVAIDVKKMGG